MKLDIIGFVASGKTTLARNLSETFHVPFYQKDNIVWERTPDGDKKRDDKERDQLFQRIINSDDWIVEGSPRKLLRECFEKCDYIILLDIPLYKRLVRTIRRRGRQRAGKEKYNSKPTIKFLYYRGYHAGKNMIMTFETSQHPINSHIIKTMIRSWLA
jgi:adenylate kinase family enzyme